MRSLPCVAVTLDRALRSPTLLAAAKATRKRVYLDKSRKDARSKGSKGAPINTLRTTSTFQEGGLAGGRITCLEHVLRTSRITTSEERSYPLRAKTPLSMALYPLIAEAESFFSCRRKTKNSTNFRRDGLETV